MMLNRREWLGGAAALLAGSALDRAGAQPARRLFDSHCHIIDHRFPIVPNQGYTPPNFTMTDYLAQVKPLGVVAGAVVSGSFQANDQTYLIDTLPKLGTGWVGVTQIPNDYPDAEIAKLGAIGIRAVRFNVFRGRIDSVDEIAALSTRAHAVAGWHSEIYADAAALKPHVARLTKLPQFCIDHLGMTEEGLPGAARSGRRRLEGEGDRLRARENGRAEGAGSGREEKPERAGVRHRHSVDARAAAVHGVRHRPDREGDRAGAREEGVLGQSARALPDQGDSRRVSNEDQSQRHHLQLPKSAARTTRPG